MDFIIGIIGLAFVASLIWTVALWVNSRKSDNKEKLKKALTITGGLFAFGVVLNILFAPISRNNSSRKSSTAKVTKKSSFSEKKQSSSSNNKKEESQKSDGYTAKQLKVINKQLVKDLREDQEFATEGNNNYDYANYVLKINLENKAAAKVWVDGNFDRLSNEAKTEVGKRTIKLIQTSIVSSGINLSAEDEQFGIRLSVWNGPQFEGHSKLLNSYEFKWK
ncbi:hypothetical protein [Lactobacillus crispatus]|uniref:hypothetical protein n=1 Tax=Lactobacillus crispatus TaxID=47770 RepID=UPI002803BB66|nr:hypothetical protein [uncultured Lactobacillus sp.]